MQHTSGMGTAFRPGILRKGLAVLIAVSWFAISEQGCPEKADLRPDGAWRPVARLSTSAATAIRTAYACSPMPGRNAVPMPESHNTIRIFSVSVLCTCYIHSLFIHAFVVASCRDSHLRRFVRADIFHFPDGSADTWHRRQTQRESDTFPPSRFFLQKETAYRLSAQGVPIHPRVWHSQSYAILYG